MQWFESGRSIYIRGLELAIMMNYHTELQNTGSTQSSSLNLDPSDIGAQSI